MTHDWNSDVWDWPLQSKDEVVHGKWPLFLKGQAFLSPCLEIIGAYLTVYGANTIHTRQSIDTDF
jgi:hypothetical protein